MNSRWAGPLIAIFILGGVALILVLNLDLGHLQSSKPSAAPPSVSPRETAPVGDKPAGFREYPIGDPVLKNHMEIKAVWLPPVQMNGMQDSASDLIHLEADIHATEGNPNGFALGEFVPYLKVHYAIVPAEGGRPIQSGELMPMVARDGLHYGASVAVSRAGSYRLTYDIKPPAADLGRHSDPATGVAPWWPPFSAAFDWDYEGLPKPAPEPPPPPK